VQKEGSLPPTGDFVTDLSVFEREQQQLAAAAPPDTSALIGAELDDVELLDTGGATVTLSQAMAGNPAVVVLYRGAWCPFCNLALRRYQDELLPALTERGIAMIAISPQHPDGSLSIKEKQELT
jgi:peroxiredoxin